MHMCTIVLNAISIALFFDRNCVIPFIFRVSGSSVVDDASQQIIKLFEKEQLLDVIADHLSYT